MPSLKENRAHAPRYYEYVNKRVPFIQSQTRIIHFTIGLDTYSLKPRTSDISRVYGETIGSSLHARPSFVLLLYFWPTVNCKGTVEVQTRRHYNAFKIKIEDHLYNYVFN